MTDPAYSRRRTAPSGTALAIGTALAALACGWWWNRRRESPLEARTRARLAARSHPHVEATATDIVIRPR